MPFKFRDVRKSLKKKGFVEKHEHHIYLHHEISGKRTGAYTYVSHGASSKEVGNDIVRSMKRQLLLSSMKDVRDLVNCPMSADHYNELLLEAGYIEPEDLDQ